MRSSTTIATTGYNWLAAVISAACCLISPLTSLAQAPRLFDSPTLVYSDQSPGSLLYEEAWKEIGRIEGPPTLLVTDVSSLVQMLPSESWSRLIVVAQHVSGEPPYAAALCAYSELHPDVPITLFTWHNNGAVLTPGTAAIGSLSITSWHHGTTSGTYVFVDYGSHEYSADGRHFADFDNVGVRNPVTFAVDALGDTDDGSDSLLAEPTRLSKRLVSNLAVSAELCPEDLSSLSADGSLLIAYAARTAFFLVSHQHPDEPLFCTKCVDNVAVQDCFVNIAWPGCDECFENAETILNNDLAHIANVIEPYLLGQCKQAYPGVCLLPLRSACYLGAWEVISVLQAAALANHAVLMTNCALVVCPHLEAECVNNNSCLILDGEPCPASHATIGDSRIPCYPEDLSALGCQ